MDAAWRICWRSAITQSQPAIGRATGRARARVQVPVAPNTVRIVLIARYAIAVLSCVGAAAGTKKAETCTAAAGIRQDAPQTPRTPRTPRETPPTRGRQIVCDRPDPTEQMNR